MSLNNDNRYLNINNVADLVKALSDKNKEQAIILQSGVEANASSIKSENLRAKEAELSLKSAIDAERLRAEKIENSLDGRLSDEINIINQTITYKEKSLQNSIDDEARDRKAEINRVETKYDERIDGLDSTLRGYTDSQVNAAVGTLRTELSNTKEIIDKDIDDLTAIVNENQRNSEGTDKQLLEKINTDIATVRSEILDHNSDYATLNTNVQNHISNFNNPHNITRDQIGAAAQTDFISLEARVTKNESDISSNDIDIFNIQTNAQALTQRVSANESNISNLKSSKLNNSGNGIVKGNLTIAKNNDGSAFDGDLIVQGNLTVNGKTTTQNHETINVENNFIVVNSDGEIIGTNLAGIAIRTNQNDAYGIAYDPSNDSVSLGHGAVNNGEFSFKQGENNPILTRAESSQLHDKHLLIWDAASNKAIDGGLYDEEKLKDTFTTWTAYNSLVTEVRNNDIDIANLQAEDVKINANISHIEVKDAEQDDRLATIELDIDNLETVKQNITDNTLKTTAKTIPTAINEVHDQLEVHEALTDNPHQVTWAQVNGTALNNTNPLMDGEASPGTLTTVSRSDHIHPTDTSRAPIDHASTSTQYGKATTNKYGHVIVDSIISESSYNPVQNKAIKAYIDTSIAALDVDGININANETISSISETDGKIDFSTQLIQINQNQVTDLQSDLKLIRDNSSRIESESESRDNLLQDNIDATNVRINDEELRAKNAENTLDSAIKVELNNRINADNSLDNKIDIVHQNLQANIDSNASRIVELEDTIQFVEDLNISVKKIYDQLTPDNYTKRWVLSFEQEFDSVGTVVGYKPIYAAIDDGELM